MKKKLVAIIMAASFMAATLLTACGGDTEADAPAPSSSEPVASAASNEGNAADGDVVSDETFAVLQQNYALMVEYHDLVAAAYNSDEIAANPEIEAAMTQAAELISQMGTVQKDAFTEENAVEFNDLMIGVVEGLTEIVDAMEPAGDGSGAEGTPVSDETFAILQQNWTTLTEFYNGIATDYNNGVYEKNEDCEKFLKQAQEILEQIQNTSREELTEESAIEINDTMISIQEQLAEAVGLSG